MVENSSWIGTVTIEISLHGHRSVQAPLIQIEFNGNILWDQRVDGEIIWKQDLSVKSRNSLVIKHHGKTSEDVSYDNQGQLIDMWCDVRYVKINGVLLDINFFSEHNYYFQADDGQQIITTYLGKNGTLIVDFPMPMWRFWAHCRQRKGDRLSHNNNSLVS